MCYNRKVAGGNYPTKNHSVHKNVIAPKPLPQIPAITEKMAHLTMVAKQLVDEGKNNVVYNWTALDKLQLGVKKTDLPILSRLVCEQRNLSWGITSVDLAKPQNSSSELIEEEELRVSPIQSMMKEKDGEQAIPVFNSEKLNQTAVGDLHQSELDSQERRVQSLECLTQTDPSTRTPGRLFQLRPNPFGRQKRSSKFQSRPDSDADTDEENESTVQLKKTPSSSMNIESAPRAKRVKVVAPDSTPPSPLILAKNAKRARMPQTRSKAVKKLQGWYF